MKTPRGPRKHSARAGMTFIEVMIVVTLLAFLARELLETTKGMSDLSSSASTQTQLMSEGHAALSTLIADFSRSGLRDIAGAELPHVFEAGVPGLGFEPHAFIPGVQEAVAGEPDFGPMHGIVLVFPSDVDRDGRPDLDLDLDGIPELDGDRDGIRSQSVADLAPWNPAVTTIDALNGLMWSHAEFAYIVETGPDGINRLLRRQDGDPLSDRVIARDVELFVVETAEDTAFAIPTNALRFTVFFRRRDANGVLYRHSVQAVVRLRNGAIE